MTHPIPPGTEALREQIARIIDPNALWGRLLDAHDPENDYIHAALAKADAILPLISPRLPEATGVREALEKAVEILRRRAAGYEGRATAIFNGRIMADELCGNAREIEALADALSAEQSGGVHPKGKNDG